LDRFVLGALAVTVALVTPKAMREPPPPGPFCPTGFAFVKIDGEMVALQDQNKSGPDECDLNVRQWLLTSEGKPDKIVGFDCWVRARGTDVVSTTTPNRPDGLCGQPPGD
jgi:hypothetical protein